MFVSLGKLMEGLINRVGSLETTQEALVKAQGSSKSQLASLKNATGMLTKALGDQAIRMVHLDKEPELFSDFRGEFYAINAPLIWEELHRKEFLSSVDVHYRRYSHRDFTKAHYYYPILDLDLLSVPTRHRWVIRIYTFFLCLLRTIEISEPDVAAERRTLSKLEFHMPIVDSVINRLSGEYHSAMTIFAGTKQHYPQVILYYSETMFSGDTDRPDLAFLCHSEEFYLRTADLASGLNAGRTSLSLPDFLLRLRPQIPSDEIKWIEDEVKEHVKRMGAKADLPLPAGGPPDLNVQGAAPQPGRA